MRLTFIGGGGHCRSLLSLLPDGVEASYADPTEQPGMPIPRNPLPDDQIAGPLHISLALAPANSLSRRRALIDSLQSREFVTLVAPSAVVTPGCDIAPGCAIFHRAVVNQSVLGPHCIVNTGAIVEHDCHLAENVFLGPGVILCGSVHIGRDCIIGAGAIVLQGVHIAPGTIVGAGATVVRDILTPTTYIGTPAKPL